MRPKVKRVSNLERIGEKNYKNDGVAFSYETHMLRRSQLGTYILISVVRNGRESVQGEMSWNPNRKLHYKK